MGDEYICILHICSVFTMESKEATRGYSKMAEYKNEIDFCIFINKYRIFIQCTSTL